MQGTYPSNLFYAVNHQIATQCTIPDPITSDVLFGLQYALSMLKPREQMALEMRYKEGKTLRQIGEAFCITGSRVRQIEINAIRHLKRPEIWKFVEYGISKVIEMEIQTAYDNGYKVGFEAGRANCYDVVCSRPKEQELPIALCDDPFERAIDELDILKRAYNCLVVHQCKTIGDVAKMKRDQIYRMRNFGTRSRLSVLNALHKYHIYDTEWEYKTN